MIVLTKTLFPLGHTVITSNAQFTLTNDEIEMGLSRHANGDWGNVPREDAELNDRALKGGSRLFSAYGTKERRFWIITEADRSVTTVLMPMDY